jgi:uncharacterized lipoprotein NlpE involved in copper resistance
MSSKNVHTLLFFVAFISTLFSSCAGIKPRTAETFAEQSFPATYTGVLPCADCEGIRYTLNMFEDEVFFLRMTYLGKGNGDSFDDIGTWDLSVFI